MEDQEEKNEIEIITGDDSDLDISTVHDHINLDKLRDKPDKDKIIIPKVKNDDENNDEK